MISPVFEGCIGAYLMYLLAAIALAELALIGVAVPPLRLLGSLHGRSHALRRRRLSRSPPVGRKHRSGQRIEITAATGRSLSTTGSALSARLERGFDIGAQEPPRSSELASR